MIYLYFKGKNIAGLKFKSRIISNMKFIVASCIFIGMIDSCLADEVKIFVESYSLTNAACVITNSTEHEVYVLPYYVREFLQWPYCSDCPTNFIPRTAIPIGAGLTLIPVASKSSIRFNVVGTLNRPWGVEMVASTNRFDNTDLGTTNRN